MGIIFTSKGAFTVENTLANLRKHLKGTRKHIDLELLTALVRAAMIVAADLGDVNDAEDIKLGMVLAQIEEAMVRCDDLLMSLDDGVVTKPSH